MTDRVVPGWQFSFFGPTVRCSVVIAARDEETRIEGTVRRLMPQRGVEAKFFIVDGMGVNSPRTSTGASGFMSNISICEGQGRGQEAVISRQWSDGGVRTSVKGEK